MAKKEEKTQLATIKAALESRADQIKSMLPRHLTPDRVIRLALTGCMRQPKLLECTTVSIVKGVMDASALGLDCSGLLGSGYLVPYRNNKTGQYEAQFIPGYRGLVDLAYRGGRVKGIDAHVVYANDKFKCSFGLAPVLEHEPDWTGSRDDKDIVAAYAIAFLEGGVTHSEVMTRTEIDAIRKRSKAKDSGPWVTDYAEMAKKTVVRRLCKGLPLSTELESALALDAQNDGVIDVDFEIPEVKDEKKGVAAVKERLNQETGELTEEPPDDIDMPGEHSDG